jgi:hypothetical protein
MSEPIQRNSGRLDIRAVAIEPIHHGAGIAGNTQLLRMQESCHPVTGRKRRVPFISGNSMKNKIRVAAVEFAIDVMEIQPGELGKREIDLLFSGGHLSSGGAAVNLSQARKIEEMFPALSMCGYSAGNVMTDSKLSVDHLHLVCEENAWRAPPDLQGHAMLEIRAGALLTKEFGTRPDRTLSARNVALLSEGERRGIEEKKSQAHGNKAGTREKDRDSLQMIYDFQCVMAGVSFYGGVEYMALTELELCALVSAFHRASSVATRAERLRMHVGAKSRVGFGAIEVELIGSIRVAAASYEPSTALVSQATGHEKMGSYNEHLRQNRDKIIAAVREAVA